VEPSVQNAQFIRFATFEVDLTAGEVRKGGVKLKLSGQPFQVLAILLEQPGKVVTREQLQQRLWPDTFVDVDHNLNTAINKIREALGDSTENPRFVETQPRRGYRFIGQIATPVLPVILIEPDHVKPSRTIWLKIAAGILATLVCTAGVGVAYRWFRHRPPLEQARPLTPLPFTALPGVEASPAFSPDGSRIAFAWNGDPASNEKGYFDLYVKGIGSETMLRLTQHPSNWLSPVWSPDGTQIAFHRIAGADTGIYIVPALGGPERKLRSTHVPYAVAAPISWSPDGKWIAFGDPLPADRIFLLSLDTLEIRPLPHDPKCRHESTPTFSYSGAKLAYVCVRSTNELELNIIELPDGVPKSVVSVSDYMGRFTWAADDSKLVLDVATAEGPEIFEALLADGQLRRLPLPPNASWPVVSSKGDKLAYSANSDKINIWRKDLLSPELPPVKFISSTQIQNQPQYSPDGKHIAFNSTRAGPWNLWLSDADGTNLVQLSKLEIAGGGTLGWSPDSKQIVVHSKPKETNETYIVDISERVFRKLVTNSVDATSPSWSRDGKWIYFRSHEAFGHKLYRCPAGGGQKVLVSADPDSIGPMESSDGHEVYFAERELNALLMKVSLERPNSEPLAKGLPRVSQWILWTIAAGGIYFVPADTPRSLCYFDFTTKQVREVFKVEKDFDNGLSVSPDGHWLLYSQVDEQNSDIMVVDHFG
jgi:Tol biopolymer transport system component/DNA-binding winged helix-turn-helix (wHTH) protein